MLKRKYAHASIEIKSYQIVKIGNIEEREEM